MFSGSTKKNNFLNDRSFGSISYFILFSLKIRPLSPTLFSSVPEKGLCKGPLTKKFTTTRNLIYERECMFLSNFTSTPVNQCLSHNVVKLSLMKFTSHKNHGSQEKLSRWRHKIYTQLWYWFRWVCWRHRNQTMMKIIRTRKNNSHHLCNGKRLKSGTAVSGWPDTRPSVYRQW
jgi:hypothetical protein